MLGDNHWITSYTHTHIVNDFIFNENFWLKNFRSIYVFFSLFVCCFVRSTLMSLHCTEIFFLLVIQLNFSIVNVNVEYNDSSSYLLQWKCFWWWFYFLIHSIVISVFFFSFPRFVIVSDSNTIVNFFILFYLYTI